MSDLMKYTKLPLFFAAALLLLAMNIDQVAQANPINETIERDRAEDPFRHPSGLYSEELDFSYIPRFSTDYLGSPQKVIARSGSFNLTERDFFCYLLASGAEDAALLNTYNEAKDPLVRRELYKQIKKEIVACLMTIRLARGANNSLTEVEQKEVELLTFPAWQTAWTMEVLEPRIQIKEMDAVREYRNAENADVFYQQRHADVRIILKRFDPPDELEEEDLDPLTPDERANAIIEYRRNYYTERDALVEELTRLQRQIEAGEISFAEAARQHSDGSTASQGGRIPPVFLGELAPQLESEIFNTPAGSMTRVVALPLGAALALVEEIHGEGFLPYEETREEAIQLSKQRGARFLFNRELEFISPREHTSDVRAWDKLESDHVVVEVDDFQLTKQELLTIYPLIEDPHRVQFNEVNAVVHAKHAAMGAWVRKLARRNGLANHPIVNGTRQMATRIVLSRQGLATRLRERMMPNSEEIAAYHTANPALFTPAPRYHITEVAAEMTEEVPVLDRPEASRLLLEDFIATCREEMEKLEATPRDLVLEWRRRQAELTQGTSKFKTREGEDDFYDFGPSAAWFPFFQMLPYFRSPFGEIEFTDFGYVFIDEVPGMKDQLKGVEPGTFAPIKTYGERATTYLVMDIEEPKPQPLEEIEPYVARQLSRDRKANLISTLLDQAGDPDRVEFLF
jgi:hypothetical protein